MSQKRTDGLLEPRDRPATRRPNDRFAYRIAVAALGVALVAFLMAHRSFH